VSSSRPPSLTTRRAASVAARGDDAGAASAVTDEEVEALEGVSGRCVMQHRRCALPSGISLHFVEAGPRDGPLVLLLHGFPDCHLTVRPCARGAGGARARHAGARAGARAAPVLYCAQGLKARARTTPPPSQWRLQLPALAAAGFRAVAADLRGYGRSDAPRGVRAYSSDAVVSDLTSLLIALRCDVAAAVVGHDWGARVAWAVAEAAPERIARLITLNVSHPLVFTRTLRTSAAQRKRSWYIAAFQLPLLPEALLSARDCAPLRRMLRTGAAEPLPPALEEAHVALFRRSGFTPPLNYYRAAARGLWPSSGARVDVPTLVLWVR
jgi:pimeloyl-ACP methyl ester carboxylesterase